MEVKDKLKRSHSLHNRTLNYSEAKSLYRRSNSVSELVARYENVRQNTLRKSQTSEQTGVGRILPERTSLLKWAEEYEKPRGALFQTNSFLGDDNGDKKEKRKSEPKIDKSKERAASGSWQAEDLCRGTARMKLTAGAERHQYEALLSPTNQRSQIRGEFHQAQNSFIPSVKQRSELFLSKAAAAESQARNPKLKFGKETDIYTSPQKKKEEKEREVCFTCLKPVYSMERIAFGKMILHQSCFCCSQCKQKLSLKNYFSVFGRLYCKVHHDQMTQGGTAVSSHEKSAAGSVPVTDLKKTKNTKEFTMAEGDMSQGRSHGEFIPTNQTCDSNDWWLRTKHITSAQESYNIAARHKGTSRWSWPNLLSATNISDTLKKGGNRGIPGRFSRVHEMNLPKVPSQDGKIFQNPTKVKEKDVLFQTLKADTNVCAASPKGMKTSKMELLQRKYEIACAKPAIKSVSRPNTRFITTNFRDIRSSPKSKLNNTESSHVLTSKAPSVAPPMSETIRLPKILQTIKEPKAGDTPIPKTSGESNNNMIQSMAEDTRTYENEASLKTSPSQQQLIQIETGMELSQLPPESNSPAHEVSLSSQTPRHDHELEG